jgi:hypothetical protein
LQDGKIPAVYRQQGNAELTRKRRAAKLDHTITGKEGEAMVELDQFKVILNSYSKPLVEVRDSL